MAYYIKANHLVAEHLHLETVRLKVEDGNYLLWQADMLAFGPMTALTDTVRAVGAIALLPHEARQEQDGTVLRPLPVATDPRFILPDPENPSESESSDPSESEPDPENSSESESEPDPSATSDTSDTSATSDASDTSDTSATPEPEPSDSDPDPDPS